MSDEKKSRDMRELSRTRWSTESTSFEAINSGSFMRIADGIESMAKGYVALERRAVTAENSAQYYERRCHDMSKLISAQRGQITKLRNRLAAMTKEQQ